MAVLKQSTAHTRTFLMVDSSDHLSPKTGLTVGIWLSKAGAAFTAVSGSVSEISFGWYKVVLNATDTNTLGDLAFHCTGTSADLTDFVDQVRANILGDTLPANVTQWNGSTPNNLISGTVDAFTHYSNPVPAFPTGTVNANLIQWVGVAPNALVSGTVDAFAHYANPVLVADKTGFSLANPQSFDLIGNITGTISNVLNVVNPVVAGVVTGSVLGNINGSVGSVTSPVGISTGTFIEAIADGVWDEQLVGHLAGGSAGHTLFSRMPTGTVNANLTQWKGSTPNDLISGTVDAFSHYSNPVQANVSITGTIDANVVTWRGTQPNVLISGTVDSYHHYPEVQVANVTGTVSANVLQWASQTVPTPANTGIPRVNVTNWASGTVSNPNVVGVPKVDLVDIDGLATNGNNATLNLKSLNVRNSNGNALVAQSDGGDGYGILARGNGFGSGMLVDGGATGKGLELTSSFGAALSIDNSAGDGVNINSDQYGVLITSSDNNGVSINAGGTEHGLAIFGSGPGSSIYAPNGIIGDITGSITGNLIGNVRGYVGFVTGSVQNVIQPVGINTGSFINAMADQVWDETLAGHLLAGSTGEKLNAAAAAGDPWTTSLPGLYAAGQAGHILASRMPTGTIPTATENADELLRRDWNSVTGTSSRSVHNALRKLRNKVSFDGVNTLTVTKEDDASSAYTQTIVTDDAQEPFKSVG